MHTPEKVLASAVARFYETFSYKLASGLNITGESLLTLVRETRDAS